MIVYNRYEHRDILHVLYFPGELMNLLGDRCSNYKQLLDEVFVITLTETLIILDITKTKSNNCFIIHWTNAKTWKSSFCFFTDGKQHKSREVDMITLGNHALRSYMT